ncbi:MAG: hypothetical protein JO244_10980 [Solirubrobacterales bacterium]|nr:hypothetical protein [Solirubrobacterales bacterium]
MTTEHEASRTLVKSPPELWAECSDAGSLARHLGEFGEITITRLDPETTVAWEGERVSGTVRIEPSGWGTKVTLTAETKLDEVKGTIETHDEPPLDAADASTGDESVNQGQLSVPPAEEEDDATVEDTLKDVDPGPGSDSDQARARWRRLTARMRGLFGSGESREETDPAPSPEAAEPVEVPEEPTADSIPLASAEPAPEPDPAPNPEPALPPDPEPTPAPDPWPAPAAVELDAEAILTSALDSLGQAHHRPFSRA